VPPNQFRIKQEIAAAELALKAHILAADPEILAEMTDGHETIRKIAGAVNLTESPEDAVCSLVIDLMLYCEGEKIDWNEEVIAPARNTLQNVRDDSDCGHFAG